MTKRTAVVITDPKGDLEELVLHGLAAAAPHRLADVWYLDPFGPGFPFNLCKLSCRSTPVDIRAMQLAALVGTVSTSTGSQSHLGMGARQVDLLSTTLLGALDCPDPRANVLWALDALSQPKGLAALAAVTKSERARSFLTNANPGDELRASCASRLRSAFAATRQLERLVTADACIDFDALTAPGQIALCAIGRPTGGLSALQRFWASELVRLAVDHLLERPSPWSGHHVRVVLEEAQIVASVLADVAENLLTTGRSRGISAVVMTQGTALLNEAGPSLVRVLLTNSPTKIIGRLAAPDAELLAREQAPAAGVDESLSTTRSRFVSAVTNLSDRSFFLLAPGKRVRFSSAGVDLGAWREAAAAREEEIEAVKRRLAVPDTSAPRITLADVAPRAERRGRRSGGGSRWG